MTIIKHHTDIDAIQTASQIIKHGGTVVFPTETVYGLGADGLNADAVAKIFMAKGRPNDNPMILHIASEAMLLNIVEDVPQMAKRLMQAFWPGPLTLIFNKKAVVPNITTGNLDTVAVRWPSHPVAITLIKSTGLPVAAPSANLSGSPSPTKANHTIDDLDGKVDMILVGDDSDIGLESTVVSVIGDIPMLLRPGAITYEHLIDVCGQVKLAPSIMANHAVEKPESPGMKYTHYAPKADVYILPLGKSQEDLRIHIQKFEAEHKKILIIDDTAENLAKDFYARLRAADDDNIDIIILKAVDTKGIGLAVMNRALKSAGYKIL